MHVRPSLPSPPVSTGGPLPLPFEFTASSSSSCNPQAQPAAPPHPSSSAVPPPRPGRLRGIAVDTPGKRPDIISEKEARGVTALADYTRGTLSNSQLLSSLAASGGSGEAAGRRLPSSTGRASPGSGPPALGTAMQLFQDDLLRKMSPMHRAAADTACNSLGSVGGASTLTRRLGESSQVAIKRGTPTYLLPPVRTSTGSKKKSSKHCFLCGKKTGLASSYECRCGNNFCGTHRYAETHACSYDYKGAGRRLLQDANPTVSAPKLPKI